MSLFSSLRKDDNANDPASLGIIKDPNAPPHHSCWKHKMESQLMKSEPRSTFPAVFYPQRNPKLLQTLAQDIRNVIRKQSATRDGGQESKIVTYEDLLKDPNVMATMKKALEIQDDPEDELINGKPWAGKTLYELFKSELDSSNDGDKTTSKDNLETDNDQDSADTSLMTTSPSPPPLSQPEHVLTVQHLVIEQDPPVLEQPPRFPSLGSGPDANNNENKAKDQMWISETLVQDQTSSQLRTLQRCDSTSSDTDLPNVPTTNDVTNNGNSMSTAGAAASRLQRSASEAKDEGTEMNCCVQLAWLDHPGVLVLLYCLALLQQIGHLGGLDFLSLLGILLATISMMSMFFL